MTRRTLGGIAAGAVLLAAIPAVHALWDHVDEPVSAEPHAATVRVLRGGSELELSGPLSRATVDALRTALGGPAPPGVVQLDSSGGSVAAAKQMGDLIRAAKAETVVTERCLSSCVAVFMAGTRRWVGQFAAIGLASTAGGEKLMPLYRSAGVPAAFLPAVADTPEGQAWFPSTTDMLSSGMATGEAGTEQFALGGFGPAPTEESVRQRLLAVPLYQAVAAADPVGFDEDVAVWVTTAVRGDPGTEAFERARTRLAHVFQRALARAPDDLLLEHARLFVDELAWMEQHRPDECAAWAAAQGGLPGPTNDGLAQRRRDLWLAVITLASARPDEVNDAVAASPVGEGGIASDCRSLRQVWQEAVSMPTATEARRLVGSQSAAR